MEKFCDKCGTLVSGDGKFCPNCGAELPGAVNLSKEDVQPSMPVAPAPVDSTYSGSGPVQQPIYPQTGNGEYTEEMTLGQWVGTILLTSCLGIVSLVLLFVWGFGDTPQPKKNYCRAMLIVQAIILGVSLLIMIGVCVCGGLATLSAIKDVSGFYYYN